MSLKTQSIDIITEVCKHLGVTDISSLYYTNSHFKNAITDNSSYIYSICHHIQPHGVVRTWWNSDNTRLKTEISHVDGKLHGEYKLWYASGQLCTHSFYVKGKLHGDSKHWYNNGQLSTHGIFLNGKKNGSYKRWHRDGQLYVYMFYVDGNLQ